jgi:hypothetical protein
VILIVINGGFWTGGDKAGYDTNYHERYKERNSVHGAMVYVIVSMVKVDS